MFYSQLFFSENLQSLFIPISFFQPQTKALVTLLQTAPISYFSLCILQNLSGIELKFKLLQINKSKFKFK